MLGLDLAVSLVCGLLALQGGDLGLGQHDAFRGHFGFQRLESELAALRRVTKPDTANTARRHEDALLAQLVTLEHCLLDLRLYAVLRVGFTARLLKQRFYAAVVSRCLATIKRISRYAHHPTGFRHVAELFGEIQQSDLVSGDSLCRLIHEGYPFGSG